jgi:hypothetical protein
MKIRAEKLKTLIIDVLPEDEELVLEYLKCRKLEITANKLVKDELIPMKEGIKCTDKRILAGTQYSDHVTCLKFFKFNDFTWELVEE